MALTKTIPEVKEALPNFVSNLSDAASLPNVLTAEYKYLVPLTGLALYNDISDKYNNTPGGMTADEISLLKMMRVVSLCYAFKDGLASGYLTFTDNGITKMNQGGTTELRKWEFEKIDSELLTTANDATEVLLNFLNEKQFDLWLTSDEYAKFTTLLIRTGTAFDDQYKLFQPNRTFFSIRSAVADAQELYLNEGIGEDLLEYLRDLDDPNDALKKAIGFLKKALAFFSIRRCTEHFNVRFSDNGFTVASDINMDVADAGRRDAGDKTLEIKLRACEESGQTFLSKAREALVAYYKDAPEDDFVTAYEEGPLVNFVDQSERTSGNENRTGVFVL
jgi:hypothetical protein